MPFAGRSESFPLGKPPSFDREMSKWFTQSENSRPTAQQTGALRIVPAWSGLRISRFRFAVLNLSQTPLAG